jgi:hypothetical protein
MGRTEAFCTLCQHTFREFRDARIHVKRVHMKCGGHCRYRTFNHSFHNLRNDVIAILNLLSQDQFRQVLLVINEVVPQLHQNCIAAIAPTLLLLANKY